MKGDYAATNAQQIHSLPAIISTCDIIPSSCLAFFLLVSERRRYVVSEADLIVYEASLSLFFVIPRVISAVTYSIFAIFSRKHVSCLRV